MRIGKDALIGTKDGAILFYLKWSDIGTLAFCAEALGIMSKIKEITLEYLKPESNLALLLASFKPYSTE